MLTWALCWVTAQIGGASEGIGALLMFSIICDTIIMVSITACWWAKYIKVQFK